MSETKRYRLRNLIQKGGGIEEYEGPTIEGTGSLKDFLIVRIDMDAENIPGNRRDRARRNIREDLARILGHDKILVLPATVEFAVFEEVPDEPIE